jgi:hypothetical protein
MISRSDYKSKPRLITVCAGGDDFDKVYSTVYSVVRPDTRFNHIILAFSIHYLEDIGQALKKYINIL